MCSVQCVTCSSLCLPQDVIVQLVGRNVSILMRSVYADKASGQHHSLETVYQPCSKDRKETFLTKVAVFLTFLTFLTILTIITFLTLITFLTKDGPLFKLKDGVVSYPDNPMVLVGLQELKDRVKLLLILRFAQ